MSTKSTLAAEEPAVPGAGPPQEDAASAGAPAEATGEAKPEASSSEHAVQRVAAKRQVAIQVKRKPTRLPTRERKCLKRKTHKRKRDEQEEQALHGTSTTSKRRRIGKSAGRRTSLAVAALPRKKRIRLAFSKSRVVKTKTAPCDQSDADCADRREVPVEASDAVFMSTAHSAGSLSPCCRLVKITGARIAVGQSRKKAPIIVITSSDDVARLRAERLLDIILRQRRGSLITVADDELPHITLMRMPPACTQVNASLTKLGLDCNVIMAYVAKPASAGGAQGESGQDADVTKEGEASGAKEFLAIFGEARCRMQAQLRLMKMVTRTVKDHDFGPSARSALEGDEQWSMDTITIEDRGLASKCALDQRLVTKVLMPTSGAVLDFIGRVAHVVGSAEQRRRARCLFDLIQRMGSPLAEPALPRKWVPNDVGAWYTYVKLPERLGNVITGAQRPRLKELEQEFGVMVFTLKDKVNAAAANAVCDKALPEHSNHQTSNDRDVDDERRSDQSLAKGESVEVEYRGSWYAGEVEEEGSDGNVRIKCDGKTYEIERDKIRRKDARDDANIVKMQDGSVVDTGDASYAKGDPVDVEYQGAWHAGEIIDESAGKVCVQSDGKRYEVERSKVRRRETRGDEKTDKADVSGAGEKCRDAANAAHFAKGQHVEVEYYGAWYASEIVELGSDKVKVQFEGETYEFELSKVRQKDARGELAWSAGDEVETKYREQWYSGIIVQQISDSVVRVSVEGKEYDVDRGDVRRKPASAPKAQAGREEKNAEDAPLAKGEFVEAELEGAWCKCEIVQLGPGKVRVRCDGKTYVVELAKVRKPAAGGIETSSPKIAPSKDAAKSAANALLAKGEPVEVDFDGTWQKSKVLEEGPGKVRVECEGHIHIVSRNKVRRAGEQDCAAKCPAKDGEKVEVHEKTPTEENATKVATATAKVTSAREQDEVVSTPAKQEGRPCEISPAKEKHDTVNEAPVSETKVCRESERGASPGAVAQVNEARGEKGLPEASPPGTREAVQARGMEEGETKLETVSANIELETASHLVVGCDPVKRFGAKLRLMRLAGAAASGELAEDLMQLYSNASGNSDGWEVELLACAEPWAPAVMIREAARAARSSHCAVEAVGKTLVLYGDHAARTRARMCLTWALHQRSNPTKFVNVPAEVLDDFELNDWLDITDTPSLAERAQLTPERLAEVEAETDTFLLFRSPPIKPGDAVEVEFPMSWCAGFKFVEMLSGSSAAAAAESESALVMEKAAVQRLSSMTRTEVPLCAIRPAGVMNVQSVQLLVVGHDRRSRLLAACRLHEIMSSKAPPPLSSTPVKGVVGLAATNPQAGGRGSAPTLRLAAPRPLRPVCAQTGSTLGPPGGFAPLGAPRPVGAQTGSALGSRGGFAPLRAPRPVGAQSGSALGPPGGFASLRAPRPVGAQTGSALGPPGGLALEHPPVRPVAGQNSLASRLAAKIQMVAMTQVNQGPTGPPSMGKLRPVRPAAKLNSKGFPLHPGALPCSAYRRSGTCSDGVTCSFDHPEECSGSTDDKWDDDSWGDWADAKEQWTGQRGSKGWNGSDRDEGWSQSDWSSWTERAAAEPSRHTSQQAKAAASLADSDEDWGEWSVQSDPPKTTAATQSGTPGATRHEAPPTASSWQQMPEASSWQEPEASSWQKKSEASPWQEPEASCWQKTSEASSWQQDPDKSSWQRPKASSWEPEPETNEDTLEQPVAEKPSNTGWQRIASRSKPGVYYYYNATTGESMPEPPPPWEKRESRSNPGVFYYWNHDTCQSSATKPEM